MTGTSFLDALKQAASDAETAEAVLRREVATRISAAGSFGSSALAWRS
jgi:hypothetical protein